MPDDKHRDLFWIDVACPHRVAEWARHTAVVRPTYPTPIDTDPCGAAAPSFHAVSRWTKHPDQSFEGVLPVREQGQPDRRIAALSRTE